MAARQRGTRAAERPVRCALEDGVARVVFDCRAPDGRLNQRGAQELREAASALVLEPRAAIVVLESAGADFCMGFDEGAVGADCVAAIAALPQPVIAVVQGRAWREGCELALAADLRVASADAEFALPQIQEGRLPRYGATQRLPRLVGPTRALELLWSGRPVGAVEAERIGIVSRVAPRGRLQRVVREVVGSLCRCAPLALRLAKEAVRAAGDLTLDQGIRLEQDLYVLLQTTADRAEGVRAFLTGRRPRFRGR